MIKMKNKKEKVYGIDAIPATERLINENTDFQLFLTEFRDESTKPFEHIKIIENSNWFIDRFSIRGKNTPLLQLEYIPSRWIKIDEKMVEQFQFWSGSSLIKIKTLSDYEMFRNILRVPSYFEQFIIALDKINTKTQLDNEQKKQEKAEKQLQNDQLKRTKTQQKRSSEKRDGDSNGN